MKFLRQKIALCLLMMALIVGGVKSAQEVEPLENPNDEPLKIPENPNEDEDKEKKMFNEIVKNAGEKEQGENTEAKELVPEATKQPENVEQTIQTGVAEGTEKTEQEIENPSDENALDLLKDDLKSEGLSITDSQRDTGKSILDDLDKKEGDSPEAEVKTEPIKPEQEAGQDVKVGSLDDDHTALIATKDLDGEAVEPVDTKGEEEKDETDLSKNKIIAVESIDTQKDALEKSPFEEFKPLEMPDVDEPEKPEEVPVGSIDDQKESLETSVVDNKALEEAQGQEERADNSTVAVGGLDEQKAGLETLPDSITNLEDQKEGEQPKEESLAQAIKEDEGHVPSLDDQLDALTASPVDTKELENAPAETEAEDKEKKVSVEVSMEMPTGQTSQTSETLTTMAKVQDTLPTSSQEATSDSASLKVTKTAHAPIVHKQTTINHLPKKIAFKSSQEQPKSDMAPEEVDNAIQSLSLTQIPASHLTIRKRTPVQMIPGKIMTKSIAETPLTQKVSADSVIPATQPSSIEDQCRDLAQLAVVISHASIPSSGKILSQTLNRFRKVLAIASATKTPLSPCCQQAFEQFVKIVYCQVTRSVVFLRDLLVDDLIENQELLKKVRFSLKYPDVAPELTWANQRLNIARDEMAQNYRLYVTNEFLTGPVPNLRQSLFNALTSMHKIDALHKQAYLQLIESMKEPNRHHYVSGEVIRLLKKVYFNMDDLSVNSKIFVGYYPVLVKVGKLVKALDAPCNEATTIFRNLAQKGIAEGQRKLQELPRPTPEQRMLSGIDRLNTGFHIHQRILEETETEANLQDATQASKPPGKFKQTITKVTNAVMKATGFIPKMMGVKMHNKRDTIGSALGQAVVGYTVLKNHKDNKKTDALLETMANDNIARQLVLHGMSRMNSGLHQIDLQIKQLNARTAALAESMSKNIDSKSAYDEQDASSKMTRI